MRNKWTKTEEQALLDKKKKYGNKDLARLFNRSEHSITSKLQDLKKMRYVRSGVKWTEKEIATLADNLDMPNDKMCARLQRGPKEVDRMRHVIRSNEKHLSGKHFHGEKTDAVAKASKGGQLKMELDSRHSHKCACKEGNQIKTAAKEQMTVIDMHRFNSIMKSSKYAPETKQIIKSGLENFMEQSGPNLVYCGMLMEFEILTKK